jgi:Tol biopolymer transport system component
MSLTPGTRLGHYSILRAIGAGGMGEVYLAEDARLRRRVALKVLPLHLALDEAAGKRLLREARAAATLQHPNICAVYEVGEFDDRAYIAMQYVEGDNLADRLAKAPLDLPTAIAIARQIADGVAEAHRHGIVHRDIKPQNVVVSAANHATVLDFGLAKTSEAGPGNAATATGLTQPGVTSGTLLYMAPEQARGEAVDERSDIFSFGIVLYQMVTRAHPFAHENWADTLAAILTREPRRVDVPIPAELRRILRKCLEKDRSRRYQTMRDVATDLENLAQELSHPVAEDVARPVPPPRSISRRTIWVAGTAAIAVIAGVVAMLAWIKTHTNTAPPPAAYEAITDFTDSATAPALSRDGRMVTFIRGGQAFLTRTGQIYVKMLPNGDPIRLTDDPRPKFGPVFSFDGSRVAYTALDVGGATVGWDTWTVPVSGGPPTRLLANAAGLSWIDAHHVMFSEIQPGTQVHMGLVTATEDRREARQIYLPSHQRAMAHFSYLSPDRAWVLLVEMGRMGTWESCRVVPFTGSSTPRLVGPPSGCRAAGWSVDGRWMYFAAEVDGPSHLWRQKFPDGAVEPLSSGPTSEEEGVAVAPDGQSLVTSIGSRHSSLWLHDGARDHLLSSEGFAGSPAYSPDGKRVYYLLRRASAPGVVELRVMDLASQKSDRLLPDFSVTDFAISRDETQLAVTVIGADRSTEIWVAALDRRTAPRRIVAGGDNVAFGADRDLVFRSLEGHINFMNRIGLDGQNRVRISDRNPTTSIHTSPDGRWVTFLSPITADRFGTIAVPVYGGPVKTLCYSGCEPEWSPDGRALYLGLSVEPPRPLLVLPLQHGRSFPDFPEDVSDAAVAWRKLPGARVIEREDSIPGLDPTTYVATRFDERRNLFRVRLPR